MNCARFWASLSTSSTSFSILVTRKETLPCLLDLDSEINSFMSVQQALKILHKIAVKRKEVFLNESKLVLIGGAGSSKQIIKSGNLKEFLRSGYAAFPQSLIICSKLTEKEKEALTFF